MGTVDPARVPRIDPERVRELGLIFLANLGGAVDLIGHNMAQTHQTKFFRPPGQESPDQSRSPACSPGWGMRFHPLAGWTTISIQ